MGPIPIAPDHPVGGLSVEGEALGPRPLAA
jgi:hypothetical protein